MSQPSSTLITKDRRLIKQDKTDILFNKGKMKQRQHRAMNCDWQLRQQQCEKWHACGERWLLKRMTQTYGSMESQGVVPGRIRGEFVARRARLYSGMSALCPGMDSHVLTVLIKGNNTSKGSSRQRSLLICETVNVGCRCLYFHKLSKGFKKF